MEYVKNLAKITKAKLEIRERGILNFWIFVDYECSGSQGVGGFALDDWNEETRQREGSAAGCEMIRRLLLELQVDDFSEMKGKYIWVLSEGEGLSFTPKGIQRLSVDGGSNSKPLIFQEVFDQFK